MKSSVLIIVENLPCPFDRRVWQEATSLRGAGMRVSIICPTGKGYELYREDINGISIYRHELPAEGSGLLGYLREYSAALYWQFRLSFKVLRERGFDVIHACNPPDNIFIIGLFYKWFFRKKFLFDHHDINPELYIAKFGRKGFFYRVMLFWERWTFWAADVSIATNESYKQIAIKRGGMDPDKVFVVRSGPNLKRLNKVPPRLELKKGRNFLVGYVGVMGKQEGLDHLLRMVSYIVYEKRRQDIQFVLIGGGTELENMKTYALKLGVEEYVTFTGRVPDKDLLSALCSSHVCVNPDVANEMNDKSTMNKIMEYMAMGKPIVQYDLTEGRFSARQSSLYAKKNNEIDFAEKILQLLDDPKKRKMMGEFGWHRIQKKLNWEYELPKLLNAYQKILT